MQRESKTPLDHTPNRPIQSHHQEAKCLSRMKWRDEMTTTKDLAAKAEVLMWSKSLGDLARKVGKEFGLSWE